MKIRRILSPTTLRIVKKKICSQPINYVEFLKLREKYKQFVLELNNLRTQKTSMLIKINDLEDRLLETQLQLERVFDDKLTHMLSIQKCPTDKRLGYVPTSISDTPSTSKTIFVRLVISESPPPRMDKEKTVMEGEVPFNPQPLVKFPIRKASHMPSLWQARAHQTKFPTLASSAKGKMTGS
jgi:hypothetical protein